MRRIRVLVPPSEGHVEAVAAHVRQLQADGRSVLYLAADRPYPTLERAFQRAGVDPAKVFFLDVVSCLDGRVPASPPRNAMFLQSPTMLEMMAMRIEQVAGRLGVQASVVIDSLNTLALYNGVPPVQEFSHYLANRLRTQGILGDFVIRDSQEGRLLHERVSGFTDERMEIPRGPA